MLLGAARDAPRFLQRSRRAAWRVPRLRRRLSPPRTFLQRCRSRGARVRRAAGATRAAQGRQGAGLGREPSRVDRVLLGMPARWAWWSCRSTTARRPRSRRACAAWWTRASWWSATRCRPSVDAFARRGDLAARGSGLERRRADARRRGHARRRHASHLHVRRDGRTQGRRHPPSQRAGQRRAGGARGAQVPSATRGRSCRCGS